MWGGQSWGKKGPGKDLCLAKPAESIATDESVTQLCLCHCLYKNIYIFWQNSKGTEDKCMLKLARMMSALLVLHVGSTTSWANSTSL